MLVNHRLHGMAGDSGTVLVADDDSDLRSLYRCWLASTHEVRTAPDGEAALQRIDSTVDAVVLDREMPETDGVAVARELDRREDPPAVVMITGVVPDVDLLDVPVDDYLQKPVTRDDVLDAVSRARTLAEGPARERELVALDTRRRIVEDAVPRRRLAGDPTYQRTLEALDCDVATLDRARPAVADGGEPPETERPPEQSLTKSP